MEGVPTGPGLFSPVSSQLSYNREENEDKYAPLAARRGGQTHPCSHSHRDDPGSPPEPAVSASRERGSVSMDRHHGFLLAKTVTSPVPSTSPVLDWEFCSCQSLVRNGSGDPIGKPGQTLSSFCCR